jgi:hypothetical protein
MTYAATAAITMVPLTTVGMTTLAAMGFKAPIPPKR